MNYHNHLDQDSGVFVGPTREAASYQNGPGGWTVKLAVHNRIGDGARLLPNEARVVAAQLVAAADEVERLQKAERP